MYSKTTTVVNASGIHARPASLFVQKASGFGSKVTVRNVTKGSDPKDAKSILMVMGLGMACGLRPMVPTSRPPSMRWLS